MSLDQSDPTSTDSPLREPSGQGLGRAWIAPALLLAGLLALGRVEVLARLSAETTGDVAWGRWAALHEWPAFLVHGLLMGAAAVALLWSTRGARASIGIFLGTLICASALTGWPIAPADEIYRDVAPGLPATWQLAVACLVASGLISFLASRSARRPGLRTLLESKLLLVGAALVGLGYPGWFLWNQSITAPEMPVREVLTQLNDDQSGWRVVHEDPAFPLRAGLLNPLVDVVRKNEVHDTFDKAALLMSPPCEVAIEIPRGSEGSALRLAAQISGRYTDRGWEHGRGIHPSELDKLGLETASVRFEVLLDDQPIFDETIVHGHEAEAIDRVWRYSGTGGSIAVEPGQKVTLRTSYGDDQTAAAFAGLELNCGFGDLVLERWSSQPRTQATPESPNILFITIDTMRTDRMSCYGYEKNTTPHIDVLAEEGMLYERAFSTASWTWPSTASLFTGLLPYEHGVLSKAACYLNFPYETLAEVLQQRGYTTAAITANPLIDATHQFDQGFESFQFAQRMRMGDEVIESMEQKLRDVAKARFYLYLHLVDPHTPHEPLASELERLGIGAEPEGYPTRMVGEIKLDGMDVYAGNLNNGDACDEFGQIHPERVIPPEHAQWMSDVYDASIGTADHYVGRILRLLDELRLTENTIVVLTSDHGEELLDHNMLGHGHTLHSELMHVPMIIAGPGLPKGVRIKTDVSNRHLAPTVANLGGGEFTQISDPINLLDPDFEAKPVFYQAYEGYWNGHRKVDMQGLRGGGNVVHYAARGGPWKRKPNKNSRTRIFSAEADFGEQANLYLDPEFAGKAKQMVSVIKRFVDEQKSRRQGESLGVGAAALRVLQNLGYAGEDETLEEIQKVESTDDASESSDQ